MSWVYTVIAWICAGVATIGTLITLSSASRPWLRHLKWRLRSGLVGGTQLVWTRVEPDDTQEDAGRGFKHYDSSMAGGISTLTSAVESKAWPRLGRGLVSYVWNRNPQGGVELYVGVTKRHYDHNLLQSFASSVHAIAVPVSGPPEIICDAICLNERESDRVMALDSTVQSVGNVVQAFAQQFSAAKERGAVIVTVEATVGSEVKRLQSFLSDRQEEVAHRTGTISSAGNRIGVLANSPARATISTTAATDREAANLSTAVLSAVSTLGFKTTRLTCDEQRRPMHYALIVSVIAAILAGVGCVVLPLHSRTLLAVLAGASLVMAVLTMTVCRWVSGKAYRSEAASGYIIPSPYTFWSPYWFIMRHVHGKNPIYNNQNKVLAAYPSLQHVLYLHPVALLELLSFPETTAALGVNIHHRDAAARGIPDAMVHQRFPVFLGVSGTDQPVTGSGLEVLHKPFISFGSPGSGKSNLIDVLYLGAVRACIDPAIPLQVTPIWCETKGEGADKVWSQIRHIRGAVYLEPHVTSTPYRLAFEGPRCGDPGVEPDDVVANVGLLVSGFQAAWGESIGAESRQTLVGALTIAMLLNTEDLKYLQIDDLLETPSRPNIIQIAYWILRGALHQVDMGDRLLMLAEDLLAEDRMDRRQRLLVDHIHAMGRYIDPKMARNNERLLQPPRNKLNRLLALNMWEPGRRRDVYISQLPGSFHPVVINLGPKAGDGTFNVDDSRLMLTVFHHLLWATAKQQCSGWQSQGKRVIACYDEAADVASVSHSGEVVDAMQECLKEGRSHGFAVFMGAQSPTQFDPKIRNYCLGIVNKAWFSLSHADDLTVACNDLSKGDSRRIVYTSEAISRLPRGVCATTWQLSASDRTPPFTLHVPEAGRWAELLLDPALPPVENAMDVYMMPENTQTDEDLAYRYPTHDPLEITQ